MDHQPVGNGNIGSRTVVITGGNTGLGFGCANTILKSPNGAPWHIILACRDEGRAQAAVDQLTSGLGVVGQVEAMALDLSSLASVRAFAAELKKRLSTGTIPPLHAVVCNAGVNPLNTKTVTADGFESTFGINHLGHFLLVNELRPALHSPARVVVVASGVHDPAQKAGVPVPAWNETAALAHGELGPAAASDNAFAAGQRRYSTSKLANVAAKRQRQDGRAQLNGRRDPIDATEPLVHGRDNGLRAVATRVCGERTNHPHADRQRDRKEYEGRDATPREHARPVS